MSRNPKRNARRSLTGSPLGRPFHHFMASIRDWYRLAINGLLLRYIAGGGERYTH